VVVCVVELDSPYIISDIALSAAVVGGVNENAFAGYYICIAAISAQINTLVIRSVNVPLALADLFGDAFFLIVVLAIKIYIICFVHEISLSAVAYMINSVYLISA